MRHSGFQAPSRRLPPYLIKVFRTKEPQRDFRLFFSCALVPTTYLTFPRSLPANLFLPFHNLCPSFFPFFFFNSLFRRISIHRILTCYQLNHSPNPIGIWYHSLALICTATGLPSILYSFSRSISSIRLDHTIPITLPSFRQ